ncbi:hypothetical protein KIPB_000314, partial [Kipferlia bialata]
IHAPAFTYLCVGGSGVDAPLSVGLSVQDIDQAAKKMDTVLRDLVGSCKAWDATVPIKRYPDAVLSIARTLAIVLGVEMPPSYYLSGCETTRLLARMDPLHRDHVEAESRILSAAALDPETQDMPYRALETIRLQPDQRQTLMRAVVFIYPDPLVSPFLRPSLATYGTAVTRRQLEGIMLVLVTSMVDKLTHGNEDEHSSSALSTLRTYVANIVCGLRGADLEVVEAFRELLVRFRFGGRDLAIPPLDKTFSQHIGYSSGAPTSQALLPAEQSHDTAHRLLCLLHLDWTLVSAPLWTDSVTQTLLSYADSEHQPTCGVSTLGPLSQTPTETERQGRDRAPSTDRQTSRAHTTGGKSGDRDRERERGSDGPSGDTGSLDTDTLSQGTDPLEYLAAMCPVPTAVQVTAVVSSLARIVSDAGHTMFTELYRQVYASVEPSPSEAPSPSLHHPMGRQVEAQGEGQEALSLQHRILAKTVNYLTPNYLQQRCVHRHNALDTLLECLTTVPALPTEMDVLTGRHVYELQAASPQAARLIVKMIGARERERERLRAEREREVQNDSTMDLSSIARASVTLSEAERKNIRILEELKLALYDVLDGQDMPDDAVGACLTMEGEEALMNRETRLAQYMRVCGHPHSAQLLLTEGETRREREREAKVQAEKEREREKEREKERLAAVEAETQRERERERELMRERAGSLSISLDIPVPPPPSSALSNVSSTSTSSTLPSITLSQTQGSNSATKAEAEAEAEASLTPKERERRGDREAIKAMTRYQLQMSLLGEQHQWHALFDIAKRCKAALDSGAFVVPPPQADMVTHLWGEVDRVVEALRKGTKVNPRTPALGQSDDMGILSVIAATPAAPLSVTEEEVELSKGLVLTLVLTSPDMVLSAICHNSRIMGIFLPVLEAAKATALAVADVAGVQAHSILHRDGLATARAHIASLRHRSSTRDIPTKLLVYQLMFMLAPMATRLTDIGTVLLMLREKLLDGVASSLVNGSRRARVLTMAQMALEVAECSVVLLLKEEAAKELTDAQQKTRHSPFYLLECLCAIWVARSPEAWEDVSTVSQLVASRRMMLAGLADQVGGLGQQVLKHQNLIRMIDQTAENTVVHMTRRARHLGRPLLGLGMAYRKGTELRHYWSHIGYIIESSLCHMACGRYETALSVLVSNDVTGDGRVASVMLAQTKGRILSAMGQHTEAQRVLEGAVATANGASTTAWLHLGQSMVHDLHSPSRTQRGRLPTDAEAQAIHASSLSLVHSLLSSCLLGCRRYTLRGARMVCSLLRAVYAPPYPLTLGGTAAMVERVGGYGLQAPDASGVVRDMPDLTGVVLADARLLHHRVPFLLDRIRHVSRMERERQEGEGERLRQATQSGMPAKREQSLRPLVVYAASLVLRTLCSDVPLPLHLAVSVQYHALLAVKEERERETGAEGESGSQPITSVDVPPYVSMAVAKCMHKGRDTLFSGLRVCVDASAAPNASNQGSIGYTAAMYLYCVMQALHPSLTHALRSLAQSVSHLDVSVLHWCLYALGELITVRGTPLPPPGPEREREQQREAQCVSLVSLCFSHAETEMQDRLSQIPGSSDALADFSVAKFCADKAVKTGRGDSDGVRQLLLAKATISRVVSSLPCSTPSFCIRGLDAFHAACSLSTERGRGREAKGTQRLCDRTHCLPTPTLTEAVSEVAVHDIPNAQKEVGVIANVKTTPSVVPQGDAKMPHAPSMCVPEVSLLGIVHGSAKIETSGHGIPVIGCRMATSQSAPRHCRIITLPHALPTSDSTTTMDESDATAIGVRTALTAYDSGVSVDALSLGQRFRDTVSAHTRMDANIAKREGPQDLFPTTSGYMALTPDALICLEPIDTHYQVPLSECLSGIEMAVPLSPPMGGMSMFPLPSMGMGSGQHSGDITMLGSASGGEGEGREEDNSDLCGLDRAILQRHSDVHTTAEMGRREGERPREYTFTETSSQLLDETFATRHASGGHTHLALSSLGRGLGHALVTEAVVGMCASGAVTPTHTPTPHTDIMSCGVSLSSGKVSTLGRVRTVLAPPPAASVTAPQAHKTLPDPAVNALPPIPAPLLSALPPSLVYGPLAVGVGVAAHACKAVSGLEDTLTLLETEREALCPPTTGAGGMNAGERCCAALAAIGSLSPSVVRPHVPETGDGDGSAYPSCGALVALEDSVNRGRRWE